MRRPPRWKLLAWGIPAWVGFGLIWYLAVTRQASAALVGMLIGLAGLALFTGIIFAWVGHNRALARRREAVTGGRRGAPDMPVVFTHDARGREVDIAPGAREHRVLVVRVEGDRKIIAPPGHGGDA